MRATLQLNELTDHIFIQDCFATMQQLPRASVDLIIADGPYAVTKHGWDKIGSVQQFNLKLIREAARVLKEGGVLYLFGKADCLDFIDYREYLRLNSRIIWYQPSRLAQGRISYTNNYDIIAYFSKGKCTTFNLDDIRVPQLVELQHRLRCENVPSVKKGRFSKTKFNDRGKNPGDVWGDIKQLTYRSKELLNREMLNTIQKPEKLMRRLILASSNPGDIIFDPFFGTGTVAAVARELGRQCFGCELNSEYARLAAERLQQLGYSFEICDSISQRQRSDQTDTIQYYSNAN